MVVEERDGAVGVDAVERECRLVLLLAQLRVLGLDSVERILRTDRLGLRSRQLVLKAGVFFVEGGEDIVGRQEPREFVLLAGQVRLGADDVDVCPLGCLHPLVCALEPVQFLRLLVECAFAAHEVA